MEMTCPRPFFPMAPTTHTVFPSLLLVLALPLALLQILLPQKVLSPAAFLVKGAALFRSMFLKGAALFLSLTFLIFLITQRLLRKRVPSAIPQSIPLPILPPTKLLTAITTTPAPPLVTKQH